MIRAYIVGVMLDGAGLHPTSKASRLTWGQRDVKVSTVRSPRRTLICGYWLWKCESRDEAVARLKRAPFGPGARLEIRRLGRALNQTLAARLRRPDLNGQKLITLHETLG